MSKENAADRAVYVALAGRGDEADLEAYVASHPRASAYHQPLYLRVLRRGGRLATAAIVARDGAAGAIVGVLPLAVSRSPVFGTFATSLPYFNYGGVLCEPERADVTAALVEAGWSWARRRGARHLVLRHTEDRPLALPATRGKETVKLALPAKGPDALFASIGSKTRNLVRKAERSGQRVTRHGPEGLPAFHRVYAENMRDLGSPGMDEAFFRVLFDELGEDARVYVCWLGSQCVAAGILTRFRDEVEVPWASSLRAHRNLQGNMLLYWAMMRDATAEGARVLDFGRSTPGTGPYRFKLQWGAQPEALPWYFVAPRGDAPTGDLSPQNPRYQLAIQAWQRLPVAIARTGGAILARWLP